MNSTRYLYYSLVIYLYFQVGNMPKKKGSMVICVKLYYNYNNRLCIILV